MSDAAYTAIGAVVILPLLFRALLTEARLWNRGRHDRSLHHIESLEHDVLDDE